MADDTDTDDDSQINALLGARGAQMAADQAKERLAMNQKHANELVGLQSAGHPTAAAAASAAPIDTQSAGDGGGGPGSGVGDAGGGNSVGADAGAAAAATGEGSAAGGAGL